MASAAGGTPTVERGLGEDTVHSPRGSETGEETEREGSLRDGRVNNVWDLLSNTRTAVADISNALQKDLQGFWREEKSETPAWHFTHLRGEALKHPYIVGIAAVAIFILSKLAATLAVYLITASITGLSGLFIISIITHNPSKLLSSLNEPIEGYQISKMASNAWKKAQKTVHNGWENAKRRLDDLNTEETGEEDEGLEAMGKTSPSAAAAGVESGGDVEEVGGTDKGRESPHIPKDD